MKRSDALAPLSRDHHHGMVVAQGLRRASEQTAASAREAFLSFWQAEGHRHFRVEEDVLLPAFAAHGPADHEAVVCVLVDHVELRRRAASLEAQPQPALEDLRELGERLQQHIRHEERVLFHSSRRRCRRLSWRGSPGLSLAPRRTAEGSVA